MIVKLCQIVSQNSPNSEGIPQNVVYLEDYKGNVVINNGISYPLSVQVEVITWDSEDDMNFQKVSSSFASESVTVPDTSVSIRQSVFNQLVSKYPSLVI